MEKKKERLEGKKHKINSGENDLTTALFNVGSNNRISVKVPIKLRIHIQSPIHLTQDILGFWTRPF